MVAEQDQAHLTRYFQYNATFNIEDWAFNAEAEKIDGRCISFLLKYYQEVMFTKGEKKRNSPDKLETNPRQWTKFFNAIGFIEDFAAKDSLELIQLIGQGIVGEYVSQFVTFINQKLDKLITPEEIMTDKFENVKKQIKAVIGDLNDAKTYKPEIASILATRLTNWLIVNADDKPVDDATIKRIEEVFTNNLFGKDLNFKLIRDLYASQDKGGTKKFNKLIFVKSIREILSS